MELRAQNHGTELHPLIPATRLRSHTELRWVCSPPKRGARRWKAGIQMSRTRINNFALGPRFRGDERRRKKPYASPPPRLPSAACAAASRAIGTRNGEHDT